MAEQQNNREEQELNHLLKVRREKLAELCESGRDPYKVTKYDVTAHSAEVKARYEELEGKEVSLAGRMMSKRVMGKASFCNLQDLQGNIQSYVARDEIGEEAYKEFKKMDIGDIIGIRGIVFTTKTGEISIHAKSVELLSKSLQILPEKMTILAEVCEWPEEIDGARANEARIRAERRLAEHSPETDIARAEAALRRALVRLSLVEEH